MCIRDSVSILHSIVPELSRRGCEGLLMIVSNPVDILTYAAWKLSGFPAHRVIGSGTVLDTARLKYLLGEHLQVDSRSVHAFVVGEHGDSELAVWSGANISGIPLTHFCELRGYFDHEASMQKIYEDVRDSAYEIIQRKGATYYGIAMAVALSLIHICWEIEKAMEVYRANEVMVVSDEIWSDIILPGHRHIPTQSVSEDARMRTVAVYAPSKTFNLAGLVGSYHIIYNPYLRERIAKESSLSHYNDMNVLSMHALIGACLLYTSQKPHKELQNCP